MNSTYIPRAIFLAAMVFASPSFAGGSEIKKCVTESGHVTLTDEVCPGGSHTVKVISVASAGNNEPSGEVDASRTVATERYTIARMPVRYATLMKSSTPARGLSLDVSTLRAARANMQIFDNATLSMKQQRVAGLQ
jgi:hypothetical protein